MDARHTMEPKPRTRLSGSGEASWHEQVPLQNNVIEASLTGPGFDKAVLRDDPCIAWGAREVAAVMIGASSDPRVNYTRRRRVFRIYETYRAACAEAKANKRPPPPNPLGWIILPNSNRIILCIRTYRAFIASQVNGGQFA